MTHGLNLPIPQPTEHVSSILHRVSRRNGFHVVSALIELLEIRDITIEQQVLAVSKLYGMPTELVVQLHTLIPFQEALSQRNESSWADVGARPPNRWLGAFREISRHARICPKCRDEDISYHRFSFYRRDHQLTLVTVCAKHGVGLIEVPEGMLSVLPEDPVLRRIPGLKTFPNEIPQIAKQFNIVVGDLLDAKRPNSQRLVGSQLKALAVAKGYRSRGKSVVEKAATLGYRVKFEDSEICLWARQALSETCSGSDPTASLEKACKGLEAKTTAYVVAALLLSDHADQASLLLRTRSIDDRSKTEAGEKPAAKTKLVSDADLIAAYDANGGHHDLVAKDLGIGLTTAYTRLLKLDRPNLKSKKPPLSPEQEIQLCITAPEAGWSPKHLQILHRLVDGVAMSDASKAEGIDSVWLEKMVMHCARTSLRLNSLAVWVDRSLRLERAAIRDAATKERSTKA